MIAPNAMIKAINLLKSKKYKLFENNSNKGSYNTTPSLKQSINYRLNRIFKK